MTSRRTAGLVRAVAVLMVAVACSGTRQHGWTTLRDEDRHFAISHPAQWDTVLGAKAFVANDVLEDPLPLIELGSFRVRPRSLRCGVYPLAALTLLPRDGVVVIIFERRDSAFSFEARPEKFEFAKYRANDTSAECLDPDGSFRRQLSNAEQKRYPNLVDPSTFHHQQLDFADGGRNFQAFLGYRDDTPKRSLQDAFAVLDSFRVDDGR